MGIRFRCHHCQHALHVKDFQAGRRSRCPSCEMPFRIPLSDQDFSVALESSQSSGGNTAASDTSGTATARSDDAEEMLSQEARNVVEPESERRVTPERSAKSSAKSSTSTVEKTKSSTSKADKTKSSGATNGDRGDKATPPVVVQEAALPQAVQDAPEAMWYVRPPSGNQYGPATGILLVQWIKEKRVTRDSLVWREGWEQWKLADASFPEIYPSTKQGPPPEPVISKDPKTQSVEATGIAGSPPDWLLTKKRRKEALRRKITVALVVLAALLTVVLVWVLFFRKPPEDKKTSQIHHSLACSQPLTPTKKSDFVVHSTPKRGHRSVNS